jgi:uncharacterized membrane protein YeaQ/YmgE (transglycosylase-associated protein family)
MDLVVTLVTGGVVGWLASIAMSASRGMGLPGYVLVGVVGSVVGTYLAEALGLPVREPEARWAASFVGALLLVWLVRGLSGKHPLRSV